MPNRFEQQARALRSCLHLAAPPIAIAFHTAPPADVDAFDDPMPAPAADVRTGRVPAGCVFWTHATERGFATVATDHANCSVGSYTHGFVELPVAAAGADTAALLGTGWVTEADLVGAPHLPFAPSSIRYEPLAGAVDPDVVLVRLSPASLMALQGACPSLRLVTKPQCQIVPLAFAGESTFSPGCAVSRARTDLPAGELTCALPAVELPAIVERLARAVEADRAVTEFAAADRKRFEQ